MLALVCLLLVNVVTAGEDWSLLHINDVYEISPNLGRVATFKKFTESQGPNLLILAGDFLSPSLMTEFKGQHMIETLNSINVDIATIGNHELDFGDDVLIQRMKEANFQWVVSNVIDTNTDKPIGGSKPYIIREIGGMKIGFLGLCTPEDVNRAKMSHTKILDPISTAAKYMPMLKQSNVDMIALITHLPVWQDKQLAELFPEIDFILGGHDHTRMFIKHASTIILKAGMNANHVVRIRSSRRVHFVPMDKSIKEATGTKKIAAKFFSRVRKELSRVVGHTMVPLDALNVRCQSTNLGNFIADAMRRVVGTDLAIINGGSIRGKKIYNRGPITKLTLARIHPFRNPVWVIEIIGYQLAPLFEVMLNGYPEESGNFPQVSGMTLTFNNNRVKDIIIESNSVDEFKVYRVAVLEYWAHVLFPKQVVVTKSLSLCDILEAYLLINPIVFPIAENRIYDTCLKNEKLNACADRE
jgi:5'-nucleotidase